MSYEQRRDRSISVKSYRVINLVSLWRDNIPHSITLICVLFTRMLHCSENGEAGKCKESSTNSGIWEKRKCPLVILGEREGSHNENSSWSRKNSIIEPCQEHSPVAEVHWLFIRETRLAGVIGFKLSSALCLQIYKNHSFKSDWMLTWPEQHRKKINCTYTVFFYLSGQSTLQYAAASDINIYILAHLLSS